MSDPVFELVTSIEAAIATYKAAAPVEVTTIPETTVVSPNQFVSPNLNRIPENAVEAAAMAASNAPIVDAPVVVSETKLV